MPAFSYLFSMAYANLFYFYKAKYSWKIKSEEIFRGNSFKKQIMTTQNLFI